MKRGLFPLLILMVLFLLSCNSEIVEETNSTTQTSASTFTGISSISHKTHRGLRLNWTEDPDAYAYFIFEIVNGTPKLIDSVDAGVTHYDVTGLSENTTKIYRVRSLNAEGLFDTNTKDVSGTTVDLSTVKVAVFGDYAGLADQLVAKYPNLQVDNYPNSNPYHTHTDGAYIVWAEARGSSKTDVFAYELASKTEIRITNNPDVYIQYPMVSGDYIVWQDNRNINYDIYAYQISTSTEFRVSTFASVQNGTVKISGDYVVWRDNRNGNFDFYGYNLQTRTEFRISSSTSIAYITPMVDGDYVVWNDNRNGDFDVFAYQLSTGTEKKLSNSTANQYSPTISGDFVIWKDIRNGNFDLYGYQLSTDQEFRITPSIISTLNTFNINGLNVVWSDNTNGNYDIFLRTITPGTPPTVSAATQVTTDPTPQYTPYIQGDYIFWTDQRNGLYDLYGYKISTTTEFRITSQTSNPINFQYQGDHILWYNYDGSQYDLNSYELSTQTETLLIDTPNYSEFPELLLGDLFIWRSPRGLTYTTDNGATSDIASKQYTSLIDNLGNYNALIVAEDVNNSAVAVFDDADAAGVPLISIGTSADATSAAWYYANANLLGMDSATTYCPGFSAHVTEVTLTTAGKNHPIFAGFDTTTPLSLEIDDPDISRNRSIEYYTASGINKPADWTALATGSSQMGPAYGEETIIEFTTDNGTPMIIDGSANFLEYTENWNDDRWDLLINEIIYMSGK